MALEQPRTELPLEKVAEICANKLIEMLGTTEMPFCFRTSSGSVYAADKQLHTVRLRAASGTFENKSLITVFLDHKYIADDPSSEFRKSEEYLANSPAVHERGYLAYINDNDRRFLNTAQDFPTEGSAKEILGRIFYVVMDKENKTILKRVPVSIVPKMGSHPVEFFDPATRPHGHRSHFGDVIEEIHVTKDMPEHDSKKGLQTLVEGSFKNASAKSRA